MSLPEHVRLVQENMAGRHVNDNLVVLVVLLLVYQQHDLLAVCSPYQQDSPVPGAGGAACPSQSHFQGSRTSTHLNYLKFNAALEASVSVPTRKRRKERNLTAALLFSQVGHAHGEEVGVPVRGHHLHTGHTSCDTSLARTSPVKASSTTLASQS